MLLLWGQRDQLVPVRLAVQVLSLRPGLPLEVLEHCGHCPHDEAPESFNRALLGWLGRLPAADLGTEPER
jgi:pimeloyl-ACP methyl ester carboxylesterase